MTKTVLATIGIALFLTRGPDSCAGHPSVPGDAPKLVLTAATKPACGLSLLSPDIHGYGSRVVDTYNAQHGC